MAERPVVLSTEVRLTEAAAADLKHIPAQRRRKQFVPDVAKDDRYWAKRKKNNIAARRSREHRRQLDVGIRQRMLNLQEDNLLLKLELDTIKKKYKLPLNMRYLSLGADGELVGTVISEKEARERAYRQMDDDMLDCDTDSSHSAAGCYYSDPLRDYSHQRTSSFEHDRCDVTSHHSSSYRIENDQPVAQESSANTNNFQCSRIHSRH